MVPTEKIKNTCRPSSETCNSSEGSKLHEPFLCKKYLHVGLANGKKVQKLGYTSKKILKQIKELQGLPDDFELTTFTVEGATKVIGNGVPLPMGRAIARAIRELVVAEHSTRL